MHTGQLPKVQRRIALMCVYVSMSVSATQGTEKGKEPLASSRARARMCVCVYMSCVRVCVSLSLSLTHLVILLFFHVTLVGLTCERSTSNISSRHLLIHTATMRMLGQHAVHWLAALLVLSQTLPTKPLPLWPQNTLCVCVSVCVCVCVSVCVSLRVPAYG